MFKCILVSKQCKYQTMYTTYGQNMCALAYSYSDGLLGKDSAMLCRCWSACKRRFEPFIHEIALSSISPTLPISGDGST